MKRLAPLALVAALALAGCTAGNQSADATPSATSTPSASASLAPALAAESPSATKTKKVDAGQAWADDMINLFLNGNSKSSFDQFNKKLPHHYITEWSEESKGILGVTVGGGKWSTKELNILGNTIMFTAGNDTPALKEVHVSSTNGATGKATRDNLQDF
ncbi:hypothetical protein [Arthrobacter sp. S41]|uniref:hypothetical protein n=1 Tax=Arthrobacter sp. S41 TaxID=2509721 RepID=UPI001036212C|nr:hypothetical protein [Arthrobacter sp. S41]TAP26876.1 hypothetical protein EYR88_00455 [Arthrobacter sp. S41]